MFWDLLVSFNFDRTEDRENRYIVLEWVGSLDFSYKALNSECKLLEN